MPRVEAVVGILEHDLDVPAARRLVEFARRHAGDRFAVEHDVAVVRIDQPADQARERALARSRFADQAERAALRDLERDIVHRAGRPAERLHHIHEFEERRRARPVLARHRDDRRRVPRQTWWRQVGQGRPPGRRRRYQTPGVGMGGCLEQRHGLALLDHATRLHHRDAIAPARGQPEIVGDQDHGHAALRLDAGQQLHHRLLRRDIEARRRLVGDQQHRLAGNGHRDHDPLAHATRQFVRIGAEPCLGIADQHGAQQVERLGSGIGARQPAVRRQHVDDLLLHRADRIQRRARVLEDHRQGRAAQPPQIGVPGMGDVAAFEEDASSSDLACPIE